MRQAELAAERLVAAHVRGDVRVVTSPRVCARLTAGPIAHALGASARVDERVAERMDLAVIDDAARGAPALVVVTHGGVTSDLMRTIAGDIAVRAAAPSLIAGGVPNGAVTTLSGAPGGWSIEGIAATEHLPATVPMARLFHVAVEQEWREAGASYERSTLGRSLAEVGFIHCSFGFQVDGIVAAHYADRDDVVVLEIDPGRLDAPVRVDAAEPGAWFPHVYGPLPREAVVAVHHRGTA